MQSSASNHVEVKDGQNCKHIGHHRARTRWSSKVPNLDSFSILWSTTRCSIPCPRSQAQRRLWTSQPVDRKRFRCKRRQGQITYATPRCRRGAGEVKASNLGCFCKATSLQVLVDKLGLFTRNGHWPQRRTRPSSPGRYLECSSQDDPLCVRGEPRNLWSSDWVLLC